MDEKDFNELNDFLDKKLAEKDKENADKDQDVQEIMQETKQEKAGYIFLGFKDGGMEVTRRNISPVTAHVMLSEALKTNDKQLKAIPEPLQAMLAVKGLGALTGKGDDDFFNMLREITKDKEESSNDQDDNN